MKITIHIDLSDEEEKALDGYYLDRDLARVTDSYSAAGLIRAEDIRRIYESRGTKPRSVADRLSAILSAWARLVERVESIGYPRSTYEYDNQLHAREGIQQLIEDVPILEGKLMSVVRPLDDRFLAATVPLTSPFLVSFAHTYRSTKSPCWWRLRHPNKLAWDMP